jgi:hypothetical protein
MLSGKSLYDLKKHLFSFGKLLPMPAPIGRAYPPLNA